VEANVIEQNGVFVVTLKGQLDFESADALKFQCQRHFKSQNVIFDLGKLSFVGSSGITPFLEMLMDLLRTNGNRLKVCSAGSEFMRIFEAGGLIGLEVYENQQQACMAFQYAAINQAPIQTAVLQKVGEFGLDLDVETESEL
jgi:anti-anti-sigma factor